jgi:hypothetical protein
VTRLSGAAEAQPDAQHLPRRAVSDAALKSVPAEVFVEWVELPSTHPTALTAASLVAEISIPGSKIYQDLPDLI